MLQVDDFPMHISFAEDAYETKTMDSAFSSYTPPNLNTLKLPLSSNPDMLFK